MKKIVLLMMLLLTSCHMFSMIPLRAVDEQNATNRVTSLIQEERMDRQAAVDRLTEEDPLLVHALSNSPGIGRLQGNNQAAANCFLTAIDPLQERALSNSPGRGRPQGNNQSRVDRYRRYHQRYEE